MASGVVFGSPPRLILQPGSYSLVDASALAFSSPHAWNLVFICGAALGGSPGRIYAFTDPFQAQQVFGPSPLNDGIRLAFRGGAPVVLAMRVDQAAQATGELAAVNGGSELVATFKDFGAYGNTYEVKFYPGTTVGYMAVVTGQFVDGRKYRAVVDNVESFSGLLERVSQETAVEVEVASGGVKASQTLSLSPGVDYDTEFVSEQYLTVVVGPSDNPASIYVSAETGGTIEDLGQQLAAQINADPRAQELVAASVVYSSGNNTSTLTLTALKPGLDPNQWVVKLLSNVQTELVATAAGSTLAGGTDPAPPQDIDGNISGTIKLDGGFDSSPTFQRWLDAIQAIRYTALRYVIPLTDNIGVQAAFADHVELSSVTANRRERIALLGHGLGWTLDQVLTRSEFFNSERVVFVSPGIQTDDGLTGNLRTYPSFYTACQVAGMLASEGNGITDPITHSFLRNVNRLEKNYQPGSLDLDRLLTAGALVIERDPPLTRASQGFRVCRGITTLRVSGVQGLSSNVFEEISHLNQSDYVAQRIRQMTDDLFVGRPLLPEVLEQIRYTVNMELLRLTRARVIFGFIDTATRVSINQTNQTAIDLYYEIQIAPAINFILSTQMLIPIPSLQASVGGRADGLAQNVGN